MLLLCEALRVLLMSLFVNTWPPLCWPLMMNPPPTTNNWLFGYRLVCFQWNQTSAGSLIGPTPSRCWHLIGSRIWQLLTIGCHPNTKVCWWPLSSFDFVWQLKAFYVDLLVPLESNIEKDTKVVQVISFQTFFIRNELVSILLTNCLT